MKLFTLAIVAIAAFLVASSAMANPNIMFIVDASGSMKEQVEGKSRMDAAKEVLITTLGKMPAEANLGLMVYGHRTAKDCNDIELVSPLGGDDAKKLQATISTLTAKGETPIAAAIKEASKSFSAFKGQKNKIILVTDGLEECKGDPCAIAKEVAADGLEVAVDVVGFTLGDAEAKAVQCITEATGGTYYDAPDAATLTAALEEAAEPTPAPEPVKSLAFEDSFEGKDLNPHWEVLNPNPDRYIIDDGKLLLVMPGLQVMEVENPDFPNLVQAIDAIPDGDWAIEAVVDFELQTSSDKAYIGVMDDQQGWIAAGIYGKGVYGGCRVYAYLDKFEGGQHTLSEEQMISSERNIGYAPCIDAFKAKGPMTITLTKSGRDYSAVISYTQDGNVVEVKPDPVKMLKPKSTLFVALGQIDAGAYRGKEAVESYLNIDSIKVMGQK